MEKEFAFKSLRRNRRGKLTKETIIKKKESELTKEDLDLLYGDFKVQWTRLPSIVQGRFLFDALSELDKEMKAEKVTEEVEQPLGHA